jgi:ribosomal protein S18 acetylase RimI-like enzyme
MGAFGSPSLPHSTLKGGGDMSESGGFVIRSARPEDEERLAEIIVLAFGENCLHAMREKRYGVLRGSSWQERKADEIRNALRNRPEFVWVAEADGIVVGFCTYAIHDNEHGEICNNGVDPAYQGRGIGKGLYRKVIELMRERGCKYAEVETGLEDGYAPARHSYEKVGFKPIHHAVRYTMRLDGR